MRRVTSLLASAGLTALVAACANSPPRPATQAEIDTYVTEASGRFGMPEGWIREVIRQESGGRTMLNGKPIVSKAGAMGLMQLMPGTYEEMRVKHGLGSDPFEPRDNILAGTAYLKDMYNLFGTPGFLGAYNCGPGCYGDYLAGKRTLPSETRNYIASIAPRLDRTPVPAGSDVMVASLPASPSGGAAALPPLPSASAPRVTVAQTLPPPPRAVSAPAPVAAAMGGGWMVQLGAFRSPDDSARVIDRARRSAPGGMLERAQRVVQPVETRAGPLYRARLAGLSQEDAANACASLSGQGMACLVVAPGA